MFQLKELLREIATQHDIRLVECEAMVDHTHLLLESERGELWKAAKKLKGASSRRLFQRFPELKLDGQTNHFWQKGYGAKVIAPHTLESVRRYIRTQQERVDKYDSRWR